MKEKSVKFNFIMNMVLTMSNFIFPLITFPYVSRILLPIGTGKVAFATSIVTYFSMFAQLGIPTYGIRVCAQVRDDKKKIITNGSGIAGHQYMDNGSSIPFVLHRTLDCSENEGG